MRLDIKKKVYEALDHAVQNGYDLTGWTAEEIASDLASYDSALEQYDHKHLLSYVSRWKRERNVC